MPKNKISRFWVLKAPQTSGFWGPIPLPPRPRPSENMEICGLQFSRDISKKCEGKCSSLIFYPLWPIKKIFFQIHLYAHAYSRIWTLRPWNKTITTNCRHYDFVASFIARANCAVNPCICFTFSENYRRGLKSLLCCSGSAGDSRNSRKSHTELLHSVKNKDRLAYKTTHNNYVVSGQRPNHVFIISSV